METKFNFNSKVCTSKEQSERLLALGLKKETADMALHFSCMDMDGNAYYIPYTIGHQCNGIPAWSLHRLLMLCNYDVQTDGHYICLPHYGFTEKDNLYDNLCDCIEWLIKQGYFNKEYLADQQAIEEHCKGVLEYLDYIRMED